MADLVVYDKAKFHYEGRYPGDLPRDQAYVHIGIYFGWSCERGLISDMVAADFEPELRRFRQREITAPRLFRLLGGTLASDMLSEKGNVFTAAYYRQKYVDDYLEVLGGTLPTLYHVADNWENFDRMKQRLDQRFGE